MPELGHPPDAAPPPRHLELVIEYSGSDLAGWQVQPDRRTAQGEVERALSELLREPTRITGASRTDAGVHALGQVASVTIRRDLPLERLHLGLNALLPADVAVRRVREVPAELHARFSARGKHYRYRILAQPARSPLEADRAWHVTEPLDLDAMREAAAHLEGRRDFRALVSRPDGDGDCVRTLHAVRVAPEPAALPGAPSILAIDVVGDGFLYKMVRTIAGTLTHVGRGKLAAGALPSVLHSAERRRAGPTAPAHGLFLVRVFYSDEELHGFLQGGGRMEGVEHADHGHGSGPHGPGRGARVRAAEGHEAGAL